MLKSWGVVVGGGGGLLHFSVSPRSLGFGFGTKGFGGKELGPGLDNKIEMSCNWIMKGGAPGKVLRVL